MLVQSQTNADRSAIVFARRLLQPMFEPAMRPTCFRSDLACFSLPVSASSAQCNICTNVYLVSKPMNNYANTDSQKKYY